MPRAGRTMAAAVVVSVAGLVLSCSGPGPAADRPAGVARWPGPSLSAADGRHPVDRLAFSSGRVADGRGAGPAAPVQP